LVAGPSARAGEVAHHAIDTARANSELTRVARYFMVAFPFDRETEGTLSYPGHTGGAGASEDCLDARRSF
jgi:hypothetical protein